MTVLKQPQGVMNLSCLFNLEIQTLNLKKIALNPDMGESKQLNIKTQYISISVSHLFDDSC